MNWCKGIICECAVFFYAGFFGGDTSMLSGSIWWVFRCLGGTEFHVMLCQLYVAYDKTVLHVMDDSFFLFKASVCFVLEIRFCFVAVRQYVPKTRDY